MESILKISPETLEKMAKLSPESRERVLKTAANLVGKKAEEILQAKERLIKAIKAFD